MHRRSARSQRSPPTSARTSTAPTSPGAATSISSGCPSRAPDTRATFASTTRSRSLSTTRHRRGARPTGVSSSSARRVRSRRERQPGGDALREALSGLHRDRSRRLRLLRLQSASPQALRRACTWCRHVRDRAPHSRPAARMGAGQPPRTHIAVDTPNDSQRPRHRSRSAVAPLGG
jgi:hypothetical protein